VLGTRAVFSKQNGQIASGESPTRRSLSASGLAAINLALRIGTQLLIVPLGVRYLGAEQFGLLILLQSISLYLLLAELGIGQSVVNYLSVAYVRGDSAQFNRILSTSFYVYLGLTAVAWILVVVVATTQPVSRWLLRAPSDKIASAFPFYLIVAASLVLPRIPLNVFTGMLLSIRQTVLRQIVDTAVVVLPFFATCAALVLAKDLVTVLVVSQVTIFLAFLAAYPLARMKYADAHVSRRFWDVALVWPLAHNSLFFALYNIGLLFQRLAGNILGSVVAPLERLPELFLLLMLVRVVGWALADALSQPLMPYAVLMAEDRRWNQLVFVAGLATKGSFTVAVVYSVGVVLLAEPFVKAWLGQTMFLGYGALLCLVGSYLLDVLFLSTNNFMRALNRHHGPALVMFANAGFSFGLGLFCAKKIFSAEPLFGLCLGFLLASGLSQLVMPVLTANFLQIGIGAYCVRFILRPTALAAVAAAGVWFSWVAGIESATLRLGYATVLTTGILMVAWSVILDSTEREWTRQRIF